MPGPTPGARQIEVAALGPFRGYATVLTASLPHDTRALDAFHVTRPAFAAVDEAGRRVQQEATGDRGRRDDPLWRIRRVLRRGAKHLSDRAWDRLLAWLASGDVDEQIARTWVAAQDMRLIYQSTSRAQAQERLYS